MASETEAKFEAKLEAKPETKPETKSELPELPLVSPIEIPAAAVAAAVAEISAAAAPATEAAKADLPKAELPKTDLPKAEPPRPDLIEQKLRLAIDMAAGRSADEIGKKLGDIPAPVAAARRLWLTPLAAAVVIAATGGAAFGSLSATALGYLWSGGSGSPNRVEANTLQTMKAELAELATLKNSVDGATRGANGQFAKIADRLDRVEHAQAEPAAKLTHIADAIDRLEKKSVVAAAAPAPETTGSIGAPASIEGTKGDKLLQDWIVQDVRRGHALVASRYGGVFDVTVGSMLPGLGHVQTISRQDGQWVVLTDKGLISER
jgi:hypothetical protein